MAKRKKKKSKSQQEYERTRARLLRARKRAEAEGSRYYFDLPLTPKQAARERGEKGKITAADYREAAKGLKGFEKLFKKVRAREKESPVIDMSMDAINNFLSGLDWPTAQGGHIIIQKTLEYVNKYSPELVARAITEMQDSGDLINSAEFYNAEYGAAYMARMGLRLRRLNKMTPEEFMQLEDQLFQDTDMVPEAIAEEYNDRMNEIMEEYGLLK